MQKILLISKYKLCVIFFYAILFILFFTFTPDVFRYNFAFSQAGELSIFVIGILFLFFILNSIFNFRTIKLQELKFSQIISISIYAFAFAIPEEIIFRGIIQNFLHNAIGGIFVPVILASAIFAFAHLPNGAQGIHPKFWNWRLVVITFLAGLLLGGSFALTNSLFIPTILHV